MVDKLKATKLRELGYTYAQIADQLDCSEAWCRKNLVSVCKGELVIEAEVTTKLKAIKILEDALQQLREM